VSPEPQDWRPRRALDLGTSASAGHEAPAIYNNFIASSAALRQFDADA